jgi:hypothetical protein
MSSFQPQKELLWHFLPINENLKDYRIFKPMGANVGTLSHFISCY